MSPAARVRLAWVLLCVSVVGWPLSALTFARNEPPTILALSWVSPILTALNILFTSDVRRAQDESEPGGD